MSIQEIKEELLEVKEDLKIFREARRAIATGQSYRIGSRQLERADLNKINETVKKLKIEKERLERMLKGRGGMVAKRAIPRDL